MEHDERTSAVRIRESSWQGDRRELMAVRTAVFVVEQHVPPEIEIDGDDPDCRHLLASDPGGRPIGTARMTPDGHLGRIAVLSEWRGRGVGTRLVVAFCETAQRRGLLRVDLNAQLSAIGFYEKLGFEARGEVFMEADIPHRNMVKPLK